MDVSKIKQMPMAFFIGTADPICTRSTADEYIAQIQSETSKIYIEGAGHLWFDHEANSDYFIENLID